MPYTEQYIKELNHQRHLFMAICLLAAITLGIELYFIVHQQSEITNQTTVIQQERRESIGASCRAQNQRHDHTIAVLEQVIIRFKERKPHLTTKQAAQLRASQQANIELIDALAPRQNCAKLVAKSVAPITSTEGG